MRGPRSRGCRAPAGSPLRTPRHAADQCSAGRSCPAAPNHTAGDRVGQGMSSASTACRQCQARHAHGVCLAPAAFLLPGVQTPWTALLALWHHAVAGKVLGRAGGRGAPATAMREASPTWSSRGDSCTERRAPAVPCSSVFRSKDVYGPSVRRLGRRMVYGRPDSRTSRSASAFHFSTPARGGGQQSVGLGLGYGQAAGPQHGVRQARLAHQPLGLRHPLRHACARGGAIWGSTQTRHGSTGASGAPGPAPARLQTAWRVSRPACAPCVTHLETCRHGADRDETTPQTEGNARQHKGQGPAAGRAAHQTGSE